MKMFRPLPLWPLLALALAAPTVQAADDDLQELMALLDQETELATRTRMNADFVPGMVTILYADDCLRGGQLTVADALGTVAGYHVSEINNGDVRTIVRGLGATQNASNLKILVNGLETNRVTDGSADWVFRLPLTMVDRIEVMRGPGSSVYGGFAFAGVVNVISRHTDSASLVGGSHGLNQLGSTGTIPLGADHQLALSASRWQQGNSGLKTGPDVFHPAFTHSPGTVYDHEQGQALLAQLDVAGFELQAHLLSATRGAGYGQSSALPHEERPRREQAGQLAITRRIELTPQAYLDVTGSWQQTSLEDAMYVPIPAGVTPPGSTAPLREDIYRGSGNEDRKRTLSTLLQWRVLDNHQLQAELGVADLRITSAYDFHSVNGQTPIYSDADSNTVIAGSQRRIVSGSLQDQWQANDDLTLTASLRYDRYSDWGQHRSPRLAAVWRASERQLLKLQYAEAFRPPTLEESNPGTESLLYGSGELSEEVLRSLELAWVWRGHDSHGNITLYRTRVEDLIEFYIDPGKTPVWRNHGSIISNGFETEWQQQISRQWQWRTSLSHNHSIDEYDADQRLLGSVDWMGTGELGWHITDSISQTLGLHYIGSQEGSENSGRLRQRRRLPDVWLLNASYEWRSALHIDDLTARLSATNLTNRRYYTAASPAQFPRGLPHGQRQLTASVSYEF